MKKTGLRARLRLSAAIPHPLQSIESKRVRIVSHTCSNTEILCALGLAEQIVGVDDHSDYPPEALSGVARIGPDLSIDVEKISALQPDLVITSLTVPGHEKCLAELQAAGLPVLVTEPVQLSDIPDDIELIAQAAGVAKRGQLLANAFRDQLEQLRQQRNKRAHPALPIAVEWWPKPVIVPAQGSWVNEMLNLVGAYNPWASQAGKSVIIDPQAAQLAAPEAVVISWCGVDVSKYHPHVVSRRPGWETVPAIRHQQIHAISEAYLGRPGPRLLEGLNQLQRIVQQISSCSGN